MNAVVEVIDGGTAVAVQDCGRTGYRSLGVPVSGAIDPFLMAAANALLGNAPDAAVLEVGLAGPALKALSGVLRISLAGNLGGQVVTSRGQARKIQPWQTATLLPGDTARIGANGGGVAYVGLSGGVDVPRQLGSRATYARAALGGIGGRYLAAGDRLACQALSGDPWLESSGGSDWLEEEGALRVILGPQDDHFTAAALQDFLGRPWRVTRDMDRMGLRLEGHPLAHNQKGADIVSDGVVPGSIQVPANGQPIVLLADAQTSGGYPKIATVIRADLPRLAHLRPGEEIRFAAVDHAAARAALLRRTQTLALWVEGITTFRPPGVLDEGALYGGNLVSGAVRGDEPALYWNNPQGDCLACNHQPQC